MAGVIVEQDRRADPRPAGAGAHASLLRTVAHEAPPLEPVSRRRIGVLSAR